MNFKYFKIKKIQLANGRIFYKVFGYEDIFSLIFGFCAEFLEEKETFYQAKRQIVNIKRNSIINEKTILCNKTKTSK